VRAFKDTELRELYLDTLLECATSAMELGDTKVEANPADAAQPGWLEAEIAREHDQIRNAVALDTFKIPSNGEVEKAVADIKYFARRRSGAVRDQVAADRAKRAGR
jgi:hypothetical protein